MIDISWLRIDRITLRDQYKPYGNRLKRMSKQIKTYWKQIETWLQPLGSGPIETPGGGGSDSAQRWLSTTQPRKSIQSGPELCPDDNLGTPPRAQESYNSHSSSSG